MAKQSGFLRRQQYTIEAYKKASRVTYVQFMSDILSLTLNDPEIMGGDVFGSKRLKRVLEGVGKNYDLFHEAIEGTKESDVVQAHLDERLKKIYGEDFSPFEERYEYVIRNKY